LKRARLAFVGDRKDARLGVVASPLRPGIKLGASTATEVVGDVLRRFEGDDESIVAERHEG